jgi:hypothetical protein
MADQPEVLLRRFSFLQKGHDGARNTATQRLALVTPGESRSVYQLCANHGLTGKYLGVVICDPNRPVSIQLAPPPEQ